MTIRMRTPVRILALGAALALLTGCGGATEDEASSASAPAGDTAPTTSESSGEMAPIDEPEPTVSDDAEGGSGEGGSPGSATLTIGDETWEFPGLLCVFGHDATQSDVYSFVSWAQGTLSDGTQAELFVQIRDDETEGRYEGDGVVHEIIFQDAENYDDPAIELSATSDTQFNPKNFASITIDGTTVTAEGTFFSDYDATIGSEGLPGTFSGTCGS